MRCLLLVVALSGLSAGTEDPVAAFRRAHAALQDILTATSFPPFKYATWDKHIALYPQDQNVLMAAYARLRQTMAPVLQDMSGPRATRQGAFWSRLSDMLGWRVLAAYMKFRPAQDKILKRAFDELRTSTWPLVERAYGEYRVLVEEVRNATGVGEDVKREVEALAKATEARYAALYKPFGEK